MKVNYLCVICLQPKEAHPVYTTGVQCSAYTPPIGTAMVKTDWQPDLKPCPKCGDCAYPLEVEEECRHITIWHCTGCAQITYTIATRAEPEPDLHAIDQRDGSDE